MGRIELDHSAKNTDKGIPEKTYNKTENVL
jgi:hypothetical protein